MVDRIRDSYYKKLKEVMGQSNTNTTTPATPATPPAPTPAPVIAPASVPAPVIAPVPTPAPAPVSVPTVPAKEDSKKAVPKAEAEVAKPVAPPKMHANNESVEEGQSIAEDEKLLEKFEDPSNEGFTLNYVEKAARDIRMKYLHSLVMMKILVPSHLKPKTHQTGITSNLRS
jgi:hypothetical protein